MSQFILPSRATDANNNPLSGALLHFYREGTTTPAPTYSDHELTVERTNPVVADSGGLFAPIYLDPDISYRVILRTAGGVTLSEFDPYSPADASLSAAANYGAKGDGTTDDTAALQAALNTGRVITLRAGATYLISSGLGHVTGAGFVCFDGTATIKAKTGVGGFNNKLASSPRTGLDRNILFCNATDDLTLLNVHFTTDNVTPVVLNGVRITGGMATEGYDLQNISFSRFFVGAMVALGSAGSGRKRNIHIASAVDSGTSLGNTYFTAGAQTTVLEIDNDIIASTPSKEGTVRIDLIRDILYSGQALADFGQETDGINIVHKGVNSTRNWDFEIGTAERIGELLDLQGFNCTARVGTAKNVYLDVVKLIHGAQNNYVEIGTVEASGRSVVDLAGSDSAFAANDTRGNTVKIGSVINPGTYGLGLIGPTTDVTVVLFANSNSIYKPVRNHVEIGSIIGDGVRCGYFVRDGGTGANNDNSVVIGQASGWFTASTNAPHSNVRVIKEGRCFTEMKMSAGQAVPTATATKLAFDTVVTDTEGLAVTASNKVTIKWPGVYRIQGKARMDSWAVGASDQWALEIRQNTTLVQNAKGKINFSAKDEVALVTHDIYVKESEVGGTGADLSIHLTQDTGASKTVSNFAPSTSFTVTRVN